MQIKLQRYFETSRTNHSATLSNFPEEDVNRTRADLKTRIFGIVSRFLINSLLMWILFENKEWNYKKNNPNEMYRTIKTGLNRQYNGDKFHGNKDIVTVIQSANCGRYDRNNYRGQNMQG
jgi:hypothetical protein